MKKVPTNMIGIASPSWISWWRARPAFLEIGLRVGWSVRIPHENRRTASVWSGGWTAKNPNLEGLFVQMRSQVKNARTMSGPWTIVVQALVTRLDG